MSTITQTGTTSMWLAALFRAAANKIDGGTIAQPSYNEVVADQRHAVQLALLDAEAEAERAVSTVTMLRTRLSRLAAGGTA